MAPAVARGKAGEKLFPAGGRSRRGFPWRHSEAGFRDAVGLDAPVDLSPWPRDAPPRGREAVGASSGRRAAHTPSNPLPPALPQSGYRDVAPSNHTSFSILGRARCASRQSRVHRDARSRTQAVGCHGPRRRCRRCRESQACQDSRSCQTGQ
jgi:hypothetical protein